MPQRQHYRLCGAYCIFFLLPQRQQIPRFGAVAVWPLLRSKSLSHLPKVCNRLGSSVVPVPAFSFPSSSSHLPKVCSSPAFSPHLPKVRNLPRPSVAPVPAFPFPTASSHLPKVCRFPAFSPHLPKVRNRLGPSVAPVPAFSFPSASSHLPKVCRFPAFSPHLPKVRNRPGPSVAPVPAFSFPAASSHLPKVCRFPAFSPHLLKVRKSRIASRRSVVAFVPFMTSSPSEGAGSNGLSPPPSHLPCFPSEKVTVKSHISRHLFGSIGDRAHIQAFSQGKVNRFHGESGHFLTFPPHPKEWYLVVK